MHIVPIDLTSCLALLFYAVMYCALCVGSCFNDGDRLHGSTLLYTILDVVVLLLRLDVLCIVDSHR
jgi:hypothetical protein